MFGPIKKQEGKNWLAFVDNLPLDTGNARSVGVILHSQDVYCNPEPRRDHEEISSLVCFEKKKEACKATRALVGLPSNGDNYWWRLLPTAGIYGQVEGNRGCSGLQGTLMCSAHLREKREYGCGEWYGAPCQVHGCWDPRWKHCHDGESLPLDWTRNQNPKTREKMFCSKHFKDKRKEKCLDNLMNKIC